MLSLTSSSGVWDGVVEQVKSTFFFQENQTRFSQLWNFFCFTVQNGMIILLFFLRGKEQVYKKKKKSSLGWLKYQTRKYKSEKLNRAASSRTQFCKFVHSNISLADSPHFGRSLNFCPAWRVFSFFFGERYKEWHRRREGRCLSMTTGIVLNLNMEIIKPGHFSIKAKSFWHSHEVVMRGIHTEVFCKSVTETRFVHLNTRWTWRSGFRWPVHRALWFDGGGDKSSKRKRN